MITETQIQNFLYEIDEPVGEDNAVLSDDQIFALANKIFNNQKKLLSLFDKLSDKPCVCGFWGDK